MKTFIKLSYALLLTLGLYSNSFGQASIYPYFAIFRLYNSSTGKHLLARIQEANSLTSLGNSPWVNEGAMGLLREYGGNPIYRFYKNGTGHFFSLNSTPPYGYISEGLIGYSAPNAGPIIPNNFGVSIYRYARIKGGSGHVYTNNYAELGGGNASWLYEGVAFYFFLKAVPD